MRSSGRPWEPSEDEILRREYPRAESTAALLLALPGRSTLAVWTRASKLGLKKSDPTMKKIRRRVHPTFGIGSGQAGQQGNASAPNRRES